MASTRLVDLLKRLPVTVTLTLSVCAVFAMQKALGDQSIAVLVRMGALVPERLVEHGETWRLVTSMFLHAGWLHFGLNTFALVQLAALVELLFGSRRLLGFYLVCGIAGGLCSALFNPPYFWPSVGASGALFGLVGVLIGVAIYGAPHWREQLQRPLRALLFAVSLNFSILIADLVVGMPINIDHFAHLGGLVTGLLLAGAYPEPMAPVTRAESALGYGSIGAMIGAFLAATIWGTDSLAELPQDLEASMEVRIEQAEEGWYKAGLMQLTENQLTEVGHPDVEAVQARFLASCSVETLFWLQQTYYADEDWDRLRPLQEQWLALDPGNPDAQNALAWSLVIDPDESDRDPRRAFQLANEAIEGLEGLDEAPSTGAPEWFTWYLGLDEDWPARKEAARASFLDTRAEALFQLGRLQEALNDQREAVDIGKDQEMATLPEMEERLERIQAAIGS